MYLGFDIGGTSVKYGIVDENFNIIEKSSFATNQHSDIAVLDDICNAVEYMKGKYSFDYIGIGAPGFVDSKKGYIEGSANTPFKHTAVVDYVEKKTGFKTYVANDANCAAYGEYLYGQTETENFVMITLGTGVGGGIILNGKLFTGSTGLAGEIGHIVIRHEGLSCPCGKRGCYEQYASATALIRLTKEKIKKSDGLMSCEMKNQIDKIDGRTVFDYIRKGATDAKEVLDKYAKYLVDGIESICSLLQPDAIILAGGITNDKELLMEYISKYYKGTTTVKVAMLQSDAGLIGAAFIGKSL